MAVIVLKGQRQRIDVLAFSPSGREILSAGNGSWLDLWPLDSEHKPQRQFGTNSGLATISDAAFIDGGRAVLAACGRDGLRVQPCSPESKVEPAAHPGLGHLMSIAVSPDGRQVIGFGWGYSRGGYNCWVTDNGAQYRADWSREDSASWCVGVAFLPGGTLFAGCERTGEATSEPETSLSVREVTSGQVITTHPCPYAFVEQLALSPDGEALVARSRMGFVVWSVGNLSRPPRKILNDNRKHFTGIAYHPSGRYLAATSNDATVKLYDTAAWAVARTYTWNIGRLRSIAFSPDGTLAAAGSDTGRVVVWDVDS